MQVKTVRIPYTKANPIKRLYLLGDIHSGQVGCAEKQLDYAIDAVLNDTDAIWAGTGDYNDLITPDDPRWQFGAVSDWVKPYDISHCQEEWTFSKFEKIKDKCVGLQWGNHEWEYKRHKFGDIHEHLCTRLGVNNLGFSCFLDLIFERENSNEAHLFRCLGTHGSSNATKSSGKQKILNDWMLTGNAQIYWYAHMHDILHQSKKYLDVDRKGHIVNREALGVVTGSFLKTYVQGDQALYGERKNYSPNKLGYPVITINIPEGTLEFKEKVYTRIDQ